MLSTKALHCPFPCFPGHRARHFYPYIYRAQMLFENMLRMVESSFFESVGNGLAELWFTKHIPTLIRIYNLVTLPDQIKENEEQQNAFKAAINDSVEAASALLPHHLKDAEEMTECADLTSEATIRKEKNSKDKIAENQTTSPEATIKHQEAEIPENLTALVQPLWQSLAQVWERFEEPQKAQGLLSLWKDVSYLTSSDTTSFWLCFSLSSLDTLCS